VLCKFSFPPTLLTFVASLVLLVLGVVIGVMVDRKKFKYQTKSTAKTQLVQSIYRATGAFPTLEKALRNNSLNEDQWGQLRDFADLINQASSTVEALGIKSKNLPKVQANCMHVAGLSPTSGHKTII